MFAVKIINKYIKYILYYRENLSNEDLMAL